MNNLENHDNLRSIVPSVNELCNNKVNDYGPRVSER